MHAMANPAAKAANTLLQAWVDGTQLSPASFPSAPTSVCEMYEVHLAIEQHPLCLSPFEGVGGYKLGALGAEGEKALYAPLFRRFIVDAPGRRLSMSALNLSNFEAEIGILMGENVTPRANGQPHSSAAVWAAASQVVLCIECCGKRGHPEAYAAMPKLGAFADTLSSGGVVMGPRFPAAGPDAAALCCTTQMHINDELVVEGSGSKAAEGDPIAALAFLANHMNGRGLSLKRGQVVITGATCNTKLPKLHDRIRATFSGFGSVEMVVS